MYNREGASLFESVGFDKETWSCLRISDTSRSSLAASLRPYGGRKKPRPLPAGA